MHSTPATQCQPAMPAIVSCAWASHPAPLSARTAHRAQASVQGRRSMCCCHAATPDGKAVGAARGWVPHSEHKLGCLVGLDGGGQVHDVNLAALCVHLQGYRWRCVIVHHQQGPCCREMLGRCRRHLTLCNGQAAPGCPSTVSPCRSAQPSCTIDISVQQPADAVHRLAKPTASKYGMPWGSP